MTRTVGEVITSARATVNDAAGDRYTDADGIDFVISALYMARKLRPDIFIGNMTTPFSPLALTDPLPIDDQFYRAIADYVIARFEMKDDEHVLDERAALMMKMAIGELS